MEKRKRRKATDHHGGFYWNEQIHRRFTVHGCVYFCYAIDQVWPASVSSSRLDVCTASRIRLRGAQLANACVCLCKCACFRACVNLCMLSRLPAEVTSRNRDTAGHLAWLDCNRRCICTYVHPRLYGGWHATGVCRARQLIKPGPPRLNVTVLRSDHSLPPWYLPGLLAVPWTIYTGPAVTLGLANYFAQWGRCAATNVISSLPLPILPTLPLSDILSSESFYVLLQSMHRTVTTNYSYSCTLLLKKQTKITLRIFRQR